jgi:hypothetical protein
MGGTSVLKEIITTSFKILGLLPAAIVALAALRKIGEETGFDKTNAKAYDRLSSWVNTLLYILIEHWFACIILSVFGGTMWGLLVVQPKAIARSEFEQKRSDRLGE